MEKHFFKTIIGENTEATVGFVFSQGKPARIYGDDPHPEEPSEIEIYEVVSNGGDFIGDLNAECIDKIEQEANEYLSDLAR